METYRKKLFELYKKEHKTKNYLHINQCKNGYLYRIHARNSNFGIYREKEKDFVIRRTKFDNTFLFEEFHWDTSEDFGTVKPLKEIEKSPFNLIKQKGNYIENNEIHIYLKKFEDEYNKVYK